MTDLVALMEATWPPARQWQQGPFTLRDGAGGGQRVSAATAHAPFTAADLTAAEAAIRAAGQPPLFMITPSDQRLDAALATLGYTVKDPVVVYAAPATQIAGTGPAPMTSFPHWPPMAIATALWAEGDVKAPRLAIMQRAKGPKTVILSRTDDRASGVAFVAIAEGTAFVHALHVTPGLRRKGAALNLMRAAGLWAHQAGAKTLALAVTAANQPARALYASLGMEGVGHYHYRMSPS